MSATEFGRPEYRHIISLGYNCAAAWQIRLHTRISEPYFFDWLYTSPEAAVKVIRNRFQGVMARENCSVVRDGAEVFDAATGIRFNHSFKELGGKLVFPELMERDWEKEEAKYAYLGRKTLAAMQEGPVLYIRHTPYPDRPDTPKAMADMEAALADAAPSVEFALWVVREVERDAPETQHQLSPRVMAWDVHSDSLRSTSNHGRSFINSDDVLWQRILSHAQVSTEGKRVLAAGVPVLPLNAEMD